MKKQEIIERYGVEEYERRKEQARLRAKQYRAAHKKEQAAYQKQYRAVHKEQKAGYNKQYWAEHKKEHDEYMKRYNTTPIGRANYLARNYRRIDKKKGFINVDNQVTGEWIVDNIFTSSCVYCGESDWTKLGCDRIDNAKPHSIDNVVCCCGKCNIERQKMPFDEFMAMHKKTLRKTQRVNHKAL